MLGSTAVVRAQSVSSIYLGKSKKHKQTDSSAPVLRDDGRAFSFYSGVTLTGTNVVSSATLIRPVVGAFSYAEGDTEFSIDPAYPDKVAFDAAFPNGIYTMQVDIL